MMDPESKAPGMELFEPHLGTVFSVKTGETEIPLTLDSVKDQRHLAAIDPQGKPVGHPSPFSLSFSSPKEILMGQSVYSISHPDLGDLHLFLKAYHESEDAFFYESIFN